jgi:hypothetical protein
MWFRWYKVPFYLVIGAAFVIGFTFIAMLLWNYTVPDLFNGPVTDFWHTLALLGLSWMFFHAGRRPYHHRGYPGFYRSRYWRKRFEEKMASMSPEDREKFEEKWKHYCGRDKCYEHHSYGKGTEEAGSR